MRIIAKDLTEQIIKETIGNPEFKCSKQGGKYSTVNYMLTPAGFDIENYKQYMYIWTFSINDLTIIGYTWKEFADVLKKIKAVTGLGKKSKEALKAMPIFVHNLKHEYHFFKYELKISDKFLIEGDNPLYVVVDDAFVFIDSYKISGKSLEDTAKMYGCKHQKTHDLDYDKPRNTEDAKHLTEEELNYCCNDTQILVEVAQFIFDNYFKKYGKLPLTMNKLVNSIIRYYYDQNKKEYAAANKRLALDKDDYQQLRVNAFRGGWNGLAYPGTHITNKSFYVDLDSAYCGAIVHGYYPVTKFVKRIASKDLFLQLIQTHCVIATLKFKGVETKNGILCESKSHVFGAKNPFWRTGGKLESADEYTTTMTELDFFNYQDCYEWEDFEVLEMHSAERGPLPDYIIQAAVYLYGEKAKLKKAGKKHTPDYLNAKTLVSNIFGAMVKKEYATEVSDITFEMNAKKKILFPQWGVYITAQVRRIVVHIAAQMDEYWLYSNTDSLFAIFNHYTATIINKYNVETQKKNKAMCEKLGLDYNIYDNLGCFDLAAGLISDFKANNVNQYMYRTIDGELECVYGGVPKRKTLPGSDKKVSDLLYYYYTGKYEVDGEEIDIKDYYTPFEFLSPSVKIPIEKTTATIIDKPSAEYVNGRIMTSKSGVIIESNKMYCAQQAAGLILALCQMAKKANDKRSHFE